jgi:hypothetical protein
VFCEEQARLLNFYRSTVSAYSATVNDLALVRGNATLQEYSSLLAVSERARTASETARLALEQHKYDHGC